jgi:hypothetical protein
MTQTRIASTPDGQTNLELKRWITIYPSEIVFNNRLGIAGKTVFDIEVVVELWL